MSKTLTLTCHGGVGAVTGANFLLEGAPGKFLIDCGLRQGDRFGEAENYEDFPYDPKVITALFVTHAHMDHIGRIPKLVRDGFRGTIYSTKETHLLTKIMFGDALSLLTREAQQKQIPPLYEQKDIDVALTLWQEIPYHETKEITEGFSVYVKDAGHILGSAMYEFHYGEKKMLFTGDLGNSPSILIKDTESPEGADYLLMESVYGDRNHETHEERDSRFAEILTDTIKRGGAVIIPAFSLERTQDILYSLNNLVEGKKIPSVPVFVDSPANHT
jgi:metallo-beta-lactamase family protein